MHMQLKGSNCLHTCTQGVDPAREVIKFCVQKPQYSTSLLVQWLRICLPMEGTQVQPLIQEDHTCHRATKPMVHQLVCPRPHAQQEKPLRRED